MIDESSETSCHYALNCSYFACSCRQGLMLNSDVFFCFHEQAESAITALSCSGMLLGTQPIRCVLLTDLLEKSSTKFNVIISWCC